MLVHKEVLNGNWPGGNLGTGGSPTPARARLLFDPEELKYDFGPEHPLQARRLVAFIDLIESCSLWSRTDEQRGLPARAATRAELELVHTAEYLNAVEQLSA